MKTLIHRSRLFGALLGLALAAAPAWGEPSLTLAVPKSLPRNCRYGGYSPVLRIDYAGVPTGQHKIKLWLLETQTDGYLCGSTFWCERVVKVDNTSGTHANGSILLAEDFDVFDYSGFLWVARLYDLNNAEVTSVRQEAAAVAVRPPTLQRVGGKSCVVGEELRFTAHAAAPAGQSIKFAARSLPPGAKFDADTGEFEWKPTQAGKFPGVIIEVSTPATGLTDAEVIEIEVKAAK